MPMPLPIIAEVQIKSGMPGTTVPRPKKEYDIIVLDPTEIRLIVPDKDDGCVVYLKGERPTPLSSPMSCKAMAINWAVAMSPSNAGADTTRLWSVLELTLEELRARAIAPSR